MSERITLTSIAAALQTAAAQQAADTAVIDHCHVLLSRMGVEDEGPDGDLYGLRERVEALCRVVREARGADKNAPGWVIDVFGNESPPIQVRAQRAGLVRVITHDDLAEWRYAAGPKAGELVLYAGRSGEWYDAHVHGRWDSPPNEEEALADWLSRGTIRAAGEGPA